jgi:hypothetical protein
MAPQGKMHDVASGGSVDFCSHSNAVVRPIRFCSRSYAIVHPISDSPHSLLGLGELSQLQPFYTTDSSSYVLILLLILFALY